jgi:hypothetical protein
MRVVFGVVFIPGMISTKETGKSERDLWLSLVFSGKLWHTIES